MQNNPNILDVSSLTAHIKSMLETNFQSIQVLGEISNFKQHTSGHRYFTLKDKQASLQCVMWRSTPLRFQPTDGMKVVLSGDISVYPPRGNYQLTVRSMKEHSAGDLLKALEELKKKLQSKGYFDQEHKRALPSFPMKIGVATSGTGAAVRDILTTLERRWPLAGIMLRPTVVQGDAAAADIAAAIKVLDNQHCDVMIVGRGGGSMEDLWAFNEEVVCDAAYHANTPIVGAVGHETDITLLDFVADVRAATPTAAAELVSPDSSDIEAFLGHAEQRCYALAHRAVNEATMRLDDVMGARGLGTLAQVIENISGSLEDSRRRMQRNMNNTIHDEQRHLQSLHRALTLTDPERPLHKGYAMILSDGKVTSDQHEFSADDELEIVTFRQRVKARVYNTQHRNSAHEKDI